MEPKISYVQDLVTAINKNPQLLADVRNDPVSTLQSLAAPPLQTDLWIYRWVVGVLGVTILLVVGAAIYVTIAQGATGKVPDVLTAMGSASIGALAGLLAPSPVSK